MEGTPKTVTICREADGWYVCFSCAEVPIQPLPLTGEETGIDLGLESFATLADGSQIANPHIFRVAEMNTSLHRDHNAARNIWRLGTEHSGAGQALQALTWAVGPSVA